MQRTECPKCASKMAWIEDEGTSQVLRCMCGLRSYLQVSIGPIVIMHNDTPDKGLKLPRPGTYLAQTLAVVQALKEVTSAEATNVMTQAGNVFSVSDVASYLAILRSKGLVCTTVVRRGVEGGSTWCLTPACKALLGDV